MWAAVTVMLVVSAPAQNEAEELFKKMEDKVHKAKTIEFESESVMEGPQKGNMNLKLTLAEGNKANMEMNFEFGERKQTMKGVSDGKNARQTQGDRPGKLEEPPKNLVPVFTVMTTRIGVSAIGRKSGGEDPFKADKFDKDKFAGLSDFKMGKKEKVGDVEAQAVEYKVAMDGVKDKMPVTVWIDPKTNLPVKRVLEVIEGDTKMTVTESIKKFKLDEKVDPKTFELPKE